MAIDLTVARAGDIVARLAPPAPTAEDLRRYATASGDLNPLHLNLEFARQAGFENLVVHGMLSMAQLGRLLTDSFPAEHIREFSARFEGVVLVGQRVCYQARLNEVADGEASLLLEGLVETSGKPVISGRALIRVA